MRKYDPANDKNILDEMYRAIQEVVARGAFGSGQTETTIELTHVIGFAMEALEAPLPPRVGGGFEPDFYLSQKQMFYSLYQENRHELATAKVGSNDSCDLEMLTSYAATNAFASIIHLHHTLQLKASRQENTAG